MNDFHWSDVVAAGIRTTSEGPFAEDVFLVLVLEDGTLEVPGGAMDIDALGAHLPGVDWEKLIRAMSCTDDRVVRIWHRGERNAVPSTADLLPRFATLVRRLGGTAVPSVAERVLAAWDEPARRYHNREHLVECLRELEHFEPANSLVELALWYHDVVYDPSAADNEERSATQLISDARELAIAPGIAHAAAALVRATTHDNTAPVDRDTSTVLDIDLSILGRDQIRVMEYDDAIRAEYAHVATEAFRAARGAFLRSLLARPKLFLRDELRARYEPSARANVLALLAKYT